MICLFLSVFLLFSLCFFVCLFFATMSVLLGLFCGLSEKHYNTSGSSEGERCIYLSLQPSLLFVVVSSVENGPLFIGVKTGNTMNCKISRYARPPAGHAHPHTHEYLHMFMCPHIQQRHVNSDIGLQDLRTHTQTLSIRVHACALPCV